MSEYLSKQRLIKARKSGTYSRLLQRYRKRWKLGKTSLATNKKTETNNGDPTELCFENQCKELNGTELKETTGDHLPTSNNNHTSLGNSCKNIILTS